MVRLDEEWEKAKESKKKKETYVEGVGIVEEKTKETINPKEII